MISSECCGWKPRKGSTMKKAEEAASAANTKSEENKDPEQAPKKTDAPKAPKAPKKTEEDPKQLGEPVQSKPSVIWKRTKSALGYTVAVVIGAAAVIIYGKMQEEGWVLDFGLKKRILMDPLFLVYQNIP